jgi:DNA-binding beta-propeller fold protein YncE
VNKYANTISLIGVTACAAICSSATASCWHYLSAGSDRIEKFSLAGDYLGDLIPSGSDLTGASQFTISPDGSTLYIGTFNAPSNVSIFNALDGSYLGNLDDGGPMLGPSVVGWSHTGSLLVSDFIGGEVYEYNPSTHELVSSFFDSEFLVNPHEVLLVDGYYLVSDYGANRVFKFNLDGSFNSIFLTNTANSIRRPLDMILSQDTSTLYVSNNASGNITVYDIETRSLLRTLGNGVLTYPEGLEWAPDGSLVVSNAGGGNIRRFDTQTGLILDTFETGPAGLGGSTDVKLISPLADLNHDGTLDIFDVNTFINAYLSENSTADLNRDGLFNIFDVTAFIASYTNTCS